MKIIRIPIHIQTDAPAAATAEKVAKDTAIRRTIENETFASVVETCTVESSQTLVNSSPANPQGTPTMERKIVNLMKTSSVDLPNKDDQVGAASNHDQSRKLSSTNNDLDTAKLVVHSDLNARKVKSVFSAAESKVISEDIIEESKPTTEQQTRPG